MNNQEFNTPKVTVHYNPYFYEETQISVNRVEQITFTHRKLSEMRVLGEFVKDRNYSKFAKRGIVKDVLKWWEKDFKTKMNDQKEVLSNKTETVKRKKIKKFDYTSIYAFIVVCVMGIIVQLNLFQVSKISQFLSRRLYNNLLIGMIYLSLVGALYLMVTKAYYEVTRLIGNHSKKFIYQEFKTIKHRFNAQQRELKAHLYKLVNINSYKQTFQLKKIYDAQEVILNLEKYRYYIQDKMVQYSKHYYILLVIAFLLKAFVLGLIIYLGISYMN